MDAYETFKQAGLASMLPKAVAIAAGTGAATGAVTNAVAGDKTQSLVHRLRNGAVGGALAGAGLHVLGGGVTSTSIEHGIAGVVGGALTSQLTKTKTAFDDFMEKEAILRMEPTHVAAFVSKHLSGIKFEGPPCGKVVAAVNELHDMADSLGKKGAHVIHATFHPDQLVNAGVDLTEPQKHNAAQVYRHWVGSNGQKMREGGAGRRPGGSGTNGSARPSGGQESHWEQQRAKWNNYHQDAKSHGERIRNRHAAMRTGTTLGMASGAVSGAVSGASLGNREQTPSTKSRAMIGGVAGGLMGAVIGSEVHPMMGSNVAATTVLSGIGGALVAARSLRKLDAHAPRRRQKAAYEEFIEKMAAPSPWSLFGGGALIGAATVATAEDAFRHHANTQAGIVHAKAEYNRNRLRYQQGFRKLDLGAQKEILDSYDNYSRAVEKGVQDNHHHIFGGSLF
jgi:hypothetical protein